MTDVVLEAAVVPCVWDNKEQSYVPVYSHRGVEIKNRIEELEAALQKIAGEPPKDTWDEGLYWWAVEIAEAALAGEKKDD